MSSAITDEDLAEVTRIRWILHSMQRCIAAIPQSHRDDLRRALEAWPAAEERAAINWAVRVLTGEHVGETFWW